MKQEPQELRIEEEIRIPLQALTRVTIACLGDAQGKTCGAETTIDLTKTKTIRTTGATCPACGTEFDNFALRQVLSLHSELEGRAERIYFRVKKD